MEDLCIVRNWYGHVLKGHEISEDHCLLRGSEWNEGSRMIGGDGRLSEYL